MYENPINLNIKYEHDPITEYPRPKEPSQGIMKEKSGSIKFTRKRWLVTMLKRTKLFTTLPVQHHASINSWKKYQQHKHDT